MPTAAQTTATPSTTPISVMVLMSASRRSAADRFPGSPQLFFGLLPTPRPTRRGPSKPPSLALAQRASGRARREPSAKVLAAWLRGPCARPSREPCATRSDATSTTLPAAAAPPPRQPSCRRLPPAGSSACTPLSTAAASPSPSPRQPAPRSVPAPSFPSSLPSSPSTLNFQGAVSQARWQRGPHRRSPSRPRVPVWTHDRRLLEATLSDRRISKTESSCAVALGDRTTLHSNWSRARSNWGPDTEKKSLGPLRIPEQNRGISRSGTAAIADDRLLTVGDICALLQIRKSV